jgi:hypothetical protein
MPKTQAKTLADFNANFNPDVKVPMRLKAALASLAGEGPEAWEYEVDFIKRAAVSTTQIAKYREQFTKHFVAVRMDRSGSIKNIWFGDPKVAEKARG